MLGVAIFVYIGSLTAAGNGPRPSSSRIGTYRGSKEVGNGDRGSNGSLLDVIPDPSLV